MQRRATGKPVFPAELDLTNRLAFLASLGEEWGVTTSPGALDDLERRLDAGAFRAASRLATLFRNRKRATPEAPSSWLEPTQPEQILPALERAMTAGAFESAERLLERAVTEPGLLERAGPAGRTLAIETCLMLGARERARQLASGHEGALLQNVRGASVLELIDSGAARDRLPDGRPHVLRLSRRIERGELTPDGLLQVIGSSPAGFLRNPELGLLLFSALAREQPTRALRFLNHFLVANGSPPAAWRAPHRARDNILDELTFEPRPRTAEGPLVSILVAAHDAAATVGYALGSLSAQSYPTLEILVADDASRDATLDVLKQRARADPRVRLFRSTTNQGPYNVKNALARYARGSLLTFHDADDLALPDRIARQVTALQASRGALASIGNFARVRPNGAFVFFKDQRATRLGLVTLLLTRAAFDRVGPFRPARFGADLELYAALRARYGPSAVARVRAPLMLGLWSPRSATQSSGHESLADGYRSPARRLYSELVFQSYVAGREQPITEESSRRLRELGNHASPSDLLPIC